MKCTHKSADKDTILLCYTCADTDLRTELLEFGKWLVAEIRPPMPAISDADLEQALTEYLGDRDP